LYNSIGSSNGEKHFRRKINEETRTKDKIEWQIQSNKFVFCKLTVTLIVIDKNFLFLKLILYFVSLDMTTFKWMQKTMHKIKKIVK